MAEKQKTAADRQKERSEQIEAQIREAEKRQIGRAHV